MSQYIRRWNTKSWNEENIFSISDVSGVYVLYDSEKRPLYVDITSNLRTKLHKHYNYDDIPEVAYFKCYHIREREGLILREELSRKLKPKYSD